MRYGTKDIVNEIIGKICAKEFKENDRLPSEQQLSIRYKVSRIVATSVYKELIKLGAIYSIQRQGYFVARYFSGVALSLCEEYNITEVKDKVQNIAFTKFMKDEHWNNNYFSFKRKHYIDNKLIIESDNWIDPNIKYKINETDLNSNFGFIKIVSTITILRFEKALAFGHKYNLISYRISYNQNNQIAWIARYIVDPEFFKMIRQQFNLPSLK